MDLPHPTSAKSAAYPLQALLLPLLVMLWISPAPAAPLRLSIATCQITQSHILPSNGTIWFSTTQLQQPADHTLRLAASQRALVTISFHQGGVVQPKLEIWNGGQYQTAIALRPAKPASSAAAPLYSSRSYIAIIPKQYVQPGMTIKATAANFTPSLARSIEVGNRRQLSLNLIPSLSQIAPILRRQIAA